MELAKALAVEVWYTNPSISLVYHISPSLSRQKGRFFLNKFKPKPIDIINAAIAEIYGEQAVDLLKFFSILNDEAKFIITGYSECLSKHNEYKKATMIRISENQEEHRV